MDLSVLVDNQSCKVARLTMNATQVISLENRRKIGKLSATYNITSIVSWNSENFNEMLPSKFWFFIKRKHTGEVEALQHMLIRENIRQKIITFM